MNGAGRPWRPGAAPSGGSVVVFAGLDWWYHNQAHSDFQLALQVARSRRVLVVNSIGTRLPVPGRTTHVAARVRRKLASIAKLVRRPRAELPDFFVYSPLTIPAYGSRAGRLVNTVLLGWQVRAVCAWLRITNPVVLVTPPTALDVATTLNPSALLFNRSDKHSAWREVDGPMLAALEQRLLRAADVVLYVSHELMAEEAALVGDRGVFLDHGVDLEAFGGRHALPADLETIPRPRVGYFGALREHTVDVHLLERVARELPEAHLVLVGTSTMDLDELLALPNVHWLGQRPHALVPSYGAGFDVALMPWHDNAWIRACNPIKMKEYLALGLRTVTTDFPEAHRYAGLLDIADGPADFVAKVRAALDEPDGKDDARRASVATESWEARAEHLLAVMKPDRSQGGWG